MIVATCVMPPLALVGEEAAARSLLSVIGEEALRQLVGPASEMWVALAQMELLLGRPDAAAVALDRLEAARGPGKARVRVRRSYARCALAMAHGDAESALAELPAEDAPGMKVELRRGGLA